MVDHWFTIGCQMVDHWFTIGCQMVDHWFTIGCQMVDHWFTITRRRAVGRVESILSYALPSVPIWMLEVLAVPNIVNQQETIGCQLVYHTFYGANWYPIGWKNFSLNIGRMSLYSTLIVGKNYQPLI